MIDPVELGKLIEKVDTLTTNVEALTTEVSTLKAAMNKGWGLVIGAAAVAGLFMEDILTAFKRMMGWS